MIRAFSKIIAVLTGAVRRSGKRSLNDRCAVSGQVPCSGARRQGKVLDEVSTAILGDAVAKNGKGELPGQLQLTDRVGRFPVSSTRWLARLSKICKYDYLPTWNHENFTLGLRCIIAPWFPRRFMDPTFNWYDRKYYRIGATQSRHKTIPIKIWCWGFHPWLKCMIMIFIVSGIGDILKKINSFLLY
jgi:hypothetical protein